MEQDHEQVKQQSEQQMQILQKRRELEQRRADFYAQRQREVQEAYEARKVATDDKNEKQQKLREQMTLAKRFVKDRIKD